MCTCVQVFQAIFVDAGAFGGCFAAWVLGVGRIGEAGPGTSSGLV